MKIPKKSIWKRFFFYPPPISGTGVYFSSGVSDSPVNVFQGQLDVLELIFNSIWMFKRPFDAPRLGEAQKIL